MIPHIIHYCWIGGAPLPPLAEECIASWKKHMPSWQIKRWDESNFDISAAPLYVRQAYEARKFAFVSDYVRLWVLEQYGGLYMDVDFEVFRPFDNLMDKYPAFAGYEGSKRKPVMQGVIASEPHGAWVRDMLQTYQFREFIRVDGSLDLTPNTSFFTDRLEAQGFVADGKEKDFFLNDVSVMPNEPLCSMLRERSSQNDEARKEITNHQSPITNAEERVFFLHVFPVHYFCPILTTGEDVRTKETYCIHRGLGSWNTYSNWRTRLAKHLSPKWRTRLIKLKRKVLG